MQKSVSIKSGGSYRFCATTYLVRGLTRRAIRVVTRPFYGVVNIERDEIILFAAQRALKNGWKTIFVFPDMHYGDVAYASNQWQFGRYDEFQYAKYLCDASDFDCPSSDSDYSIA